VALRSASLRRAVTGFAFKALSSPLEKACRLLVVFVVAPALGATAFGTYQFATTVALMLTALAGFGLGPWTTRALARDRDGLHAVMAAGLRLRAFAAIPFLALLGLVAWREDAGDARWAMIVLGVAALAHSFVDYYGAILRGREDFRQEAAMNAVRALSTTLCALGAFFVTRSLMGLATGIAVGSLASAVWGLWYVRHVYRDARHGSTVSQTDAVRVVRDVLREAGPLWLSGLLATLYFRTDILFVRYFAGEAEVGSYAAAYRIFEATMLLPSTVMHVAFPRLARAHTEQHPARQVELPLTLLLVALGVIVAVLLVAADAGVVRALLGPAFARSEAPLRVLACTVPVMFASYAVGDFVIARGREAWLVRVLGAMLALNVVLNLLMVPRMGGTGAAWSTLVTEVAFVACGIALLARGLNRGKTTREGAS
jgi:O-antigen/teichoic acid export membrane protein